MVLKKSNCHNVNSGNTMRKSCYSQLYLRNTHRTTHVMKILSNSKYATDNDRQEFEVDPADSYVEDGGLQISLGRNYWHVPHLYSLNKRKRWLMEDAISTAINDVELAEEPFKITLVHRTVPCHGCVNNKNSVFNVRRYYDSKLKASPVLPNQGVSSRHELLRKGTGVQARQVDQRALNKSRRRQGHNQHFRCLQRKTKRIPKSKPPEVAAEPDEDNVAEIRYEVGVAEDLNSASFKYCKINYRPYCSNQPGTRFRGFHREEIRWFSENSYLFGFSQKQHPNKALADFMADQHLDAEEDLEASWDAQEHSGPAAETFSLLDFAVATQNKNLRSSKRRHHKDTVKSETAQVNPASNQRVKKYGKGSAIFDEQERVEEGSDEGLDLSHTQDTEEDMTELTLPEMSIDSGVEVDYKTEFAKSDSRFCSCRILQSEFNSSQLRCAFGNTVEFGNCVPLTARFDVHAVQHMLNEEAVEQEVKTHDGEWWLLCQAGERLLNQIDSTQHTQEDIVIVNLKLYNSRDDCKTPSANLELQNLMRDDGDSVYESMSSLLLHVVHMMMGLQLLNKGHQVGNTSNVTDTSLSSERPTKPVFVRSVSQAYQHLKAVGKVSALQVRDDADLESACSLTWCDVQCAICFTYFDDSTSLDGHLCPFVVLSTCGHSFCRDCWQHHLVYRIMEGQDVVNCMNYQCGTTINPTTLMSLIPQWVYTKWQRHLYNTVVESSGDWTWCPNPRCGLLASSPVSDKGAKLGKKKAVTVTCDCQKEWCLECTKDGHWPTSCEQFNTYTKMLKQKGDEDGMKSEPTQISYVHVKRCPGCHYPMEKNGGCSHMTCSRCFKHFCWECLLDWGQHYTGNWTGCNVRQTETVELGNEKIYPLPIKYYKKAVSFRYKWKLLLKSHYRTIKACVDHSNFMKQIAKRKSRVTREGDLGNAVTIVIGALGFLKKGLAFLELSYVLLSNTSRHESLAKPLRADLDLLEFMCDRINWYLDQPVKKILHSSVTLHRITDAGGILMNTIYRRCQRLASQMHNTSAQEWLLTTDHEKFVKYK